MDSFGFDFPGGDILDLGSLGMWGGSSTPMGSSPNSGGGALPFSVGTPTGVQSLGDEPFASLSAAGADDFSFGDSPKPAGHKDADGGADDLAPPYFGGDLDAATSASAAATATSSTATASAPASASSDAKPLKPEPDAKKEPTAPTSSTPGSAAASSVAASSAAPTSAAGPSASTTSAARPHINGPHVPSPSQRPSTSGPQQQALQQQQPQPHQQQERYPGQMMVNQGQVGGFPGAPQQPQQPQQAQYQMHQAHLAGQNPQANGGQYMTAPQQAYRPPTSSYDEEFMRVKAMMMQHPDLIPPPMEVLRISMSQSNPAMMNQNYIQQQQQRGQQVAMNRPGYPPYGGNGMMGGPQAGMMNPNGVRMGAMGQQMAGGRPQARTPQGGNPGSGGAGDTPTAWQSENDLPLRRKMIGKMYVSYLGGDGGRVWN